MWWIVLEAIGALAALLFVVWWTMFSGRRQGELMHGDDPAPAPRQEAGVQPAQDADLGGSKKLRG